MATQRIFSQGDFQQTENPLDLVIEGDGFFQVQRSDGTTAYTRAGAFKKDGTGRMVTSDGSVLIPNIVIPADAKNITIGSDGTVTVTVAGQTAAVNVGSIQIAQFVNPGGLLSVGRNLFVSTPASGTATLGTPGTGGFGTLTQGFLELANVKVVDEMVNMITSQRAYEANSKAIQTADEMLAISNSLRRG
jgi:flagellar basal-body rod protein FlgG